jgi:hypothetical protein
MTHRTVYREVGVSRISIRPRRRRRVVRRSVSSHVSFGGILARLTGASLRLDKARPARR